MCMYNDIRCPKASTRTLPSSSDSLSALSVLFSFLPSADIYIPNYTKSLQLLDVESEEIASAKADKIGCNVKGL